MTNPLPPRCSRRFEWVRLLASGGFGSVHLARDLHLNRDVAVKLLRASSAPDDSALQRARSEALIAARLNHPHIVKILDHDVESGQVWLAYEYVAGLNVRQLLDKGAFEIEAALLIVQQVLEALEEAHSHGIVHRDIKPENILQYSENHFKLTDFGIAKWNELDGVKTADELLMGSPAYVSPERIRGQNASAASDVYAVGVTLFELITGILPFPGNRSTEVLKAHLFLTPPALSLLSRATPPEVEAIVLKALAKDPAERFESAAAMSRAILAARQSMAQQGPLSSRHLQRTRALVLHPPATSLSTLVRPSPARRQVRAISVAVGAVAATLVAAWTVLAPSRRHAPSHLRTPVASPAGLTAAMEVDAFTRGVEELAARVRSSLPQPEPPGYDGRQPGGETSSDALRQKSLDLAQYAQGVRKRLPDIPAGETASPNFTQALIKFLELKESIRDQASESTTLVETSFDNWIDAQRYWITNQYQLAVALEERPSPRKPSLSWNLAADQARLLGTVGTRTLQLRANLAELLLGELTNRQFDKAVQYFVPVLLEDSGAMTLAMKPPTAKALWLHMLILRHLRKIGHTIATTNNAAIQTATLLNPWRKAMEYVEQAPPVQARARKREWHKKFVPEPVHRQCIQRCRRFLDRILARPPSVWKSLDLDYSIQASFVASIIQVSESGRDLCDDGEYALLVAPVHVLRERYPDSQIVRSLAGRMCSSSKTCVHVETDVQVAYAMARKSIASLLVGPPSEQLSMAEMDRVHGWAGIVGILVDAVCERLVDPQRLREAGDVRVALRETALMPHCRRIHLTGLYARVHPILD